MPGFKTNDTPSTAARVANDGHERAAAPTDATAATPAAPAAAMVVDSIAHERGENSDINARILTALDKMTSRMDRLEMSQMQIDENERLCGAIDSGLFGSALDRGNGGVPMNHEALGFMPPKRSPEPPAAPLPRLRASVMGQSFLSLSVYENRHRSSSNRPRKCSKPTHSKRMRQCNNKQRQHRLMYLRQYKSIGRRTRVRRKLAIRKFDGSELY
ncbi:unnamed protein product [Peronospora farinosa]|uniref:Uncharacterized protein n=1 Tax=Peronospora farinosa TaxID=134698 RepID=A0AAV0U2I6_9STRA|nr:unnamed protein product [Peronospora farinosa]